MTPEWLPRALAVLLLLAVLAPAFGLAAGAVGYAEPLDNAAEATGATEHAEPTAIAPFPDYGIGIVGGPLETFLSASIGIALTLLVAFALGRLLGTEADGYD